MELAGHVTFFTGGGGGLRIGSKAQGRAAEFFAPSSFSARAAGEMRQWVRPRRRRRGKRRAVGQAAISGGVREAGRGRVLMSDRDFCSQRLYRPETKKTGIPAPIAPTAKGPFDQIVRRGLSDEVLNTLRKAIVAGAFAPGDHVAEASLALQLGVSRVPVREAMITLEREGLLEFDERGAARVRNFTAADFEEIFTMRLALEPLAAQLACRRLQSADVAALTENIGRMRRTSSLLEVTMLDVDFHDLIMQSARHNLLLACWGNLRSLLRVWLARLHRREPGPKETKSLTVSGHAKLVKILQSGHEEAAAEEMRRHLVSWRQRMPKSTWEGDVS